MIMKISVHRLHRIGYFAVTLLMAACTSSRPATPSSSQTAPQPSTTTPSMEETNTVSLLDGVFSQPQVEKGKEIFESACVECHQPEAFIGPGFIGAWAGQTVDVLFQEIRRTMPENAPGRLSRREYAAVLAYIFELNGLPTGENDMPNRPQQLKEIRIETAVESRKN
ncbi:MAG: cytochrome c [Bacteroidetes bacterium]|nr:MAG: cytochrome c [Bacteroidota bacterium]